MGSHRSEPDELLGDIWPCKQEEKGDIAVEHF